MGKLAGFLKKLPHFILEQGFQMNEDDNYINYLENYIRASSITHRIL